DAPLPGARAALAASPGAVVLTARADAEGVRRQVARLRLLDPASVIVVSPGGAAERKAEILATRRPALFVGDTESDGRAAQLAGVPFLAVDTGQRDAAFLAARGWPPVPGGVRAAVAQALATT
ncbi:MAG TPA: HAD family hydrolase, partial [Solirubrobacteraceae bacterium]